MVSPSPTSGRAVASTPPSAKYRRHITPEMLARLLGVQHRVVLRWVRSGELPALNITSGHAPRYRIFRPDLIVFLRSRGASETQVREITNVR